MMTTYHNNVTLGIDGYALRPQELTIARALRSQEASRLEVRIDDQQSMIIEISDDNVTYCKQDSFC